MGNLRESLSAAMERFGKEGTDRLNEAKAKAARVLVQAAEQGEYQINMQAGTLFPAERAAFEQWLRSEGVMVDYVGDQRDGDFYRLTIQR